MACHQFSNRSSHLAFNPLVSPLRLSRRRSSTVAPRYRGLDATDVFADFDAVHSDIFEFQRRMMQQQERMFDEMNRDFERMDREMEQFRRELPSGPGNYTYRRETTSPNLHTTQSITVWSSTPVQQAAPLVSIFSSLVMMAALAASVVYTALAAIFKKNYALTRYHHKEQWKLVLLWPVLYLFSEKFRAEFQKAVQANVAGRFNEDNAAAS